MPIARRHRAAHLRRRACLLGAGLLTAGLAAGCAGVRLSGEQTIELSPDAPQRPCQISLHSRPVVDANTLVEGAQKKGARRCRGVVVRDRKTYEKLWERHFEDKYRRGSGNFSVALTPDGTKLVLVNPGEGLYVFDARSGAQQLFSDKLKSAGSILATNTEVWTWTGYVYDLATGTKQSARVENFATFDISENGASVITGHCDVGTRVAKFVAYEAATRKVLWRDQKQGKRRSSCGGTPRGAVSADGKTFLTVWGKEVALLNDFGAPYWRETLSDDPKFDSDAVVLSPKAGSFAIFDRRFRDTASVSELQLWTVGEDRTLSKSTLFEHDAWFGIRRVGDTLFVRINDERKDENKRCCVGEVGYSHLPFPAP